MPEKPERYRIYLLTVWAERSRDPAVPATWRFSLLDPSTGRRRAFASPEALVAALQEATTGAADGAGKEDRDDA